MKCPVALDHYKKRASAKKAVKRLRTIAGALMRELERKLPVEVLAHYAEDFSLYSQVLNQKKNDSNKIYSLHEPQAHCIAKGKDHKLYEYGAKASIVTTTKFNIIVGVMSHADNIADVKTLPEVIKKVNAIRKTPITEAVCGRGYRGVKTVEGAVIILPKKPLKRDSRYQRDVKRNKCRRRAAIEPIIGHLKSHYRLAKNYLKGTVGDGINLLMAACALNLSFVSIKQVPNSLSIVLWILNERMKGDFRANLSGVSCSGLIISEISLGGILS